MFGGDVLAGIFVDVFAFYEEYGVWGPGGEDKLEWSLVQVRGKEKLTSLEYLEKNPLKLE
jgi:hypothetical protein